MTTRSALVNNFLRTDIKADLVQVVNVEWTKQNLVALRNFVATFLSFSVRTNLA